MQLPVLLEKLPNHRYRATGAIPVAFSAEGDSEEEAVRNYRDAVAARLLGGGKILTIDLPETPAAEHPWKRFAGTLPDDELTAEWLREIEIARSADDIESLSE